MSTHVAMFDGRRLIDYDTITARADSAAFATGVAHFAGVGTPVEIVRVPVEPSRADAWPWPPRRLPPPPRRPFDWARDRWSW